MILIWYWPASAHPVTLRLNQPTLTWHLGLCSKGLIYVREKFLCWNSKFSEELLTVWWIKMIWTQATHLVQGMTSRDHLSPSLDRTCKDASCVMWSDASNSHLSTDIDLILWRWSADLPGGSALCHWYWIQLFESWAVSLIWCVPNLHMDPYGFMFPDQNKDTDRSTVSEVFLLSNNQTAVRIRAS